jgi:hypothetical protein
VKIIARVNKVVVSGIQQWCIFDASGKAHFKDMPDPEFVEIEPDGGDGDPCMMYRYRDDGTFCGDTWHKNIAAAKHQAEYEYGIKATEWVERTA